MSKDSVQVRLNAARIPHFVVARIGALSVRLSIREAHKLANELSAAVRKSGEEL